MKEIVICALSALFILPAFRGYAQNDAWFDKANSNSLERAHKAFLEGEHSKMSSALRNVFLDSDASATEKHNALQLLERAYQLGGGHVSADWKLQDGLEKLSVTQVRKEEPEHLYFRLKIRAHMKRADLVKQVRLTRPNGEVVLDRLEGIGEWQVDPEDDGGFSFELSSEDRTVPCEDGLYLLRIETQKETVDGWFIMSNLLASTAPDVLAPKIGAKTVAEPVVRWVPYRSPEYQDFERRSLVIYAVKLMKPGYKIKWLHYAFAPEHSEVRIDKPLERGDYWLAVTFREERRFGPVRLQRASRTARHFFVR